MANVEQLNQFNEVSLLLKFVKEYDEITFSNFYNQNYNFIYNILLYEKVRSEYEEEFTKAYRSLKETK